MNTFEEKRFPTKDICYRVRKTLVKVMSNSTEWLSLFDSLLSIPKTFSSEVPALELKILSVPEVLIDHLLPLPRQRLLKHEGPSFSGHDFKYRLFAGDGVLWSDWEKYGRIKTERSAGKSFAVINSESGMDLFYSVLLFGYNTLLGLMQIEGLFSVHASCVSVGGKGMLFTGQSGSGKSTSAYALARRGHGLVSDDRLLLLKEGRYLALNISDVFKIREDALIKFFPALRSVSPLHNINDEFYYKTKGLPGIAYTHSVTLDAIFVLDKSGTKLSSIDRVHPARVVKDLFPVTINPYDPEQSERKFRFLMDVLADVPCYKASFGTDMDLFAESVEQIAAAL